ncbi:MAG: hypothetical protein ACJA0G_000102 [Kangiellaceae bacterium]|jgi:uncharacterized protein (DUF1499 family)
MSKLLKWLAVLSALGFPLALVGFRMGLYEFGTGFKILNYSFYLAVAVLLVGLVVLFLHRRSKPTSSRSAMIAVAISVIPIVGLGSQVFVASSVPAIHNISTDIIDPPQFDLIVAMRGEGTNPLEYSIKNGDIGELQKKAYPYINTITVSSNIQTAFNKAVDAAEDLGWVIVNKNKTKGIIEATQTTTLWQFKDDIVIRVRSNAQTPDITDIDLRSVSRIGQSDLGANAKRIKRFKEQFLN